MEYEFKSIAEIKKMSNDEIIEEGIKILNSELGPEYKKMIDETFKEVNDSFETMKGFLNNEKKD